MILVKWTRYRIHHAKSEGNICQVTFSKIHLNSRVTWVVIQNYNDGPFVLIRESPHFLLSVWPELLMEVSSCHLACIPLNFGMVIHCKKKLSQLPAVDMQHAPAKLPSKLHLSAYVDSLAQSLCSMHSDCASKFC